MPKNPILYRKDFKEKQKEIGERHKSIRTELHLRIQDIAEQYRIGPSTISDSENGKQAFPLSYITSFCQQHDINLAWMIHGDKYTKRISDITETVFPGKVSETIEKYGVEAGSSDPYLQEIIEYLSAHPELKKSVWHLIQAKKGGL